MLIIIFKKTLRAVNVDSAYTIKKNTILLQHAGGTEILWEHLGYDATLAFIQSGHSGAAYKMLAKFLIGRLRQPEAH